MYEHDGILVELELIEEIRMNQLVRSHIDLAGFQNWYSSLSADGQVVLLFTLHSYAQQAGGREDVYHAAVQAAQIPEEQALVQELASFRGPYSRTLNIHLRDWLKNSEGKEREVVLSILVHYFGIAERRVLANHTPAGCNHWWHRDLLDERVVNDLLKNPRYAYTSMKDDLIIKGEGNGPH